MIDGIENTYIVEFKKGWFHNIINIYHHCNADRGRLLYQDVIMTARLHGKLRFCSMTDTEYKWLWNKENNMLRQYMYN